MTLTLIVHPAHPPSAITGVEVDIHATDWSDVLLTFRVRPAAALLIPEPASPARTDELWKTTCFELFLKPEGGDGYIEFNLSPSSKWAAYAFDGYRAGMRDLALAVEPHVSCEAAGEVFELEADIDFSGMANDAMLGSISAVIEEIDGTKSFWALAHPPEAPDFHHADCFVLELPAAV